MFQHQTTTIEKTGINSTIESLEKLLQRKGPEPHEYAYVLNLMDQLQSQLDNNEISIDHIVRLRSKCKMLQSSDTLLGHILLKPYGYAGDFEIIDKVYQNKPTSKIYYKWDNIILNDPAAKAVRNRKKYFVDLVFDKVRSNKSIHICNVASGPARDVKELYDLLKNKSSVKTTCIELDQKAISFASELTKDYNDQIKFIQKNALRFTTDEKFDLVWSAGLFDYFNDKVFIRLLNRFSQWVKPGGEIVIGNFNEEYNPFRSTMELIGDWYLHHRTPLELRKLAILAGAEPNQISIEQEEQGINLFLRIKY